MERKNAWSQYSAEELSRLEAVNEDYKACLYFFTERACSPHSAWVISYR